MKQIFAKKRLKNFVVTTHRRAFLQENPPEHAPHSAGSVRRDHRRGTWPAPCTPRYIGCQFLQHTQIHRGDVTGGSGLCRNTAGRQRTRYRGSRGCRPEWRRRPRVAETEPDAGDSSWNTEGVWMVTIWARINSKLSISIWNLETIWKPNPYQINPIKLFRIYGWHQAKVS